MKQDLACLKKAIIDAGRRVYDRGYVASNDGNISARLDKSHILITPTGVGKGFMNSADLIVIDYKGNVVKGKKKPSSESLLHLRIYKERSDVNSVCHAHPPYATGFAVACIPLNQNILPEVIISLGSIPLVPYAVTGTEEFCTPLLPILKHYDAFLLANHGALTVGRTVLDAYHKMETLEHIAKILFIAQHLGNVNKLDDKQVQVLISRIEEYCVKTHQLVPKSKGEFIRCILESLAFKYKDIVERIRTITEIKIETLHIVGGGSQNDLLNQLTANEFGIPVAANPVEATALGNILVQALAKKVLSSLQKGRELVANSYPLKWYKPAY